MFSRQAYYPVSLFSLGLFLVLIILPLLRHGMFVDGVIYAAIAKNLSMGVGSLWQPYYTQTLYPAFYEHPPLAIYFQSLLFKWFGQGEAVERLYCFGMAFGQFALIAWFWLKTSGEKYASLGLLLLAWLLVPLNLMYKSNLLEASLALFSTAASFILLLRAHSFKWLLLQFFLSAILILIAFFCNGPTAFFPLAIPFVKSLFDEDTSLLKGMAHSLLLLTMIAAIFLSFFIWIPEALSNTLHYFEQQLFASVVGERGLKYTGLKHLHVFALYLRAILPIGLFSMACVLIATKLTNQSYSQSLKKQFKNKWFLIFLLLSLISSLPVGISHRQSFNYIMQSAPFITLAGIFFCFSSFQKIAEYCQSKSKIFKSLTIASFLFFLSSAAFTLSQINGFNRDERILHDVTYLTKYLDNHAVLSTSQPIYFNWYAGAYFARHSMISLTITPGKSYYLALQHESLPKAYTPVDLPLHYYRLGRLS